MVRGTRRTYVYCKCSDGCRMVIQYGLENEKLVREAKNEHEHGRDARADIRAIASKAQPPAAALVKWSLEHPVQTRRQYAKTPQKEDKIPEVLAYVKELQARQARASWQFKVLQVDDATGIICFTADFYIAQLLKHWDMLVKHGFPLACDGTHNISNSDIKLIALSPAHPPKQH